MFAAGVEVVGVDGDDTLWRCQDLFDAAEVELAQLLADRVDADEVARVLQQVECGNLPVYGYGIKGWTLSCLQTVLQVTGGDVDGALVQAVLDLGRRLLLAPVEVLPGAQEALAALERSHRVVLVTKGDLVDQQGKLARSGLARHFTHVEVVSEKDTAAYAELLRALDCPPERFLMVGNSEVSDIHPVLDLGGWAVHVPYHTTWQHERAAMSREDPRRATVTSLTQVPGLLVGDRTVAEALVERFASLPRVDPARLRRDVDALVDGRP